MFRRLIPGRRHKAQALDEQEVLAGITQQSTPVQFPSPREHDLASLRPRIIQELQRIVGVDNMLTEEADLIAYSIDGTWIERRPLAVVLPTTAEQVSAILRLANHERIVVAPRGSASGLSGGSVPLAGGIALALTRMNRILEIDTTNLIPVVDPGEITPTFHSNFQQPAL